MKVKKAISRLSALIFAVVLSLFAAACSKTEEKAELHLYSWEDYIDPELLEQFEKEYNCKVKLETFASNEQMYAKLKNGASGYDVVVPSSYMAKVMYEQKMLEELDLAQLPNMKKYYDKTFDVLNMDKDHVYTAPYFISFTGIGYDASKVKDFEPTWKMFEREDLKGKTSLLDDHREVLGAALKSLGYDVNTVDEKQLDEAVALARKWKQNIAKFGVDDSRQNLADGSFFLIQTYSGDLLQNAVDNENLKFVIPREGSTVTFDNLCILKNSKQKDLAYKFINFLYENENAAKNMDYVMYRMPHTEAVKSVDESIRDHELFNIKPEVFKLCTPLDDLGENQKLYSEAWDKIKQ